MSAATKREAAQPTVIVSFNALRFGGSQTLAHSLASRLSRCGFNPVIVGKRGRKSAWFERRWDVQHVVWAEGVGAKGGFKQRLAVWSGYASIARLAISLRSHPPVAWIASQPWPIHYAAVTRRVLWPDAIRIGLVHGTTEVELPPPRGRRDLAGMDRFVTSTEEAVEELRASYGIEGTCIGNLFNADEYWERPRLADRTPTGEAAASQLRVLFLGTLTTNKITPLRALLQLAADGRRLEVTIVGDGPERAGLEALARRRGLRARFMGALLDPRAEIERADIVVTGGRGAIEAGSRPRPVVVATSDGVFGALTPDRLRACRAHNFTGRASGSEPVTPAAIARALEETERIGTDDLASNAASLAEVGDIEPLLELLRPCKTAEAALQRDLETP